MVFLEFAYDFIPCRKLEEIRNYPNKINLSADVTCLCLYFLMHILSISDFYIKKNTAAAYCVFIFLSFEVVSGK